MVHFEFSRAKNTDMIRAIFKMKIPLQLVAYLTPRVLIRKALRKALILTKYFRMCGVN